MGEDYPPLVHAIVDGSLANVQALLADDANAVHVRSTDGGSLTPLHVAADEGQDRMVSLLLDKGADKDALDCDGGTPLCFAVENGHLAVVETLVAAGADVKLRSTDGHTPLHLAATKGHDEVL